MESLGRYQLKRMLGEGAMSQVYLAYDPKLQRELAIKLLKPEFAQDAQRVELFLNEIQLSGRLHHPNIVSIFDVGQVDEVHFILMQHFESRNLESWLEDNPDLSIEQALRIVDQLLQAIEHAHAKGIYHRDIKPSNILINDEGLVQLTDFGVAYLNDSGVTDDAFVIGTPFYMAPEQLQGHRPTAQSDLYSIGVLLYYLVFGKLPFQASTLKDLDDLIQRSEVDLESKQIPSSLKKVIRKLLHKNPAFRYQSATELLKQLHALRTELKDDGRASHIRISTTWRNTGLVALCFGMLCATLLYLTVNQLSSSLRNTLVSYGDMFVAQMHDHLAEPVLLGDNASMTAIINRFSAADEILYVHIVDNEGRIMVSTDPVEPGSYYQAPPGLARLQLDSQYDVFHYPLDTSGSEIYRFSSRIQYANSTLGRLYVGVKSENLDGIVNKTFLYLLSFILMICALVVAVVYLIYRYFFRQIKLLNDALQSLYAGNFYTRLNVERKDEVGTLKAQFNDLAEQLEHFFDQQRDALPVDDLNAASSIAEMAEVPIEADKTVILNRNKGTEG
ncbi:Serine/threonine protein kinase PrkC, regulator of stationary phase [Nitrincola lacisaponensis]|uniref:Serine/threonine protein kinase PrkC, regulator of stationary phase n=1 Tax=Nitrincola lacisaponensis TaxID=267850 RepID=A0A063Y3L3_9GAMM|nr:serine/threonine-protein kinase [Nitrincola lacisaponensis]KDE40893.1 Serine/threonine protein kinase PrkC, regulator of stationary phase [Nitrincola lacisaponensis]